YRPDAGIVGGRRISARTPDCGLIFGRVVVLAVHLLVHLAQLAHLLLPHLQGLADLVLGALLLGGGGDADLLEVALELQDLAVQVADLLLILLLLLGIGLGRLLPGLLGRRRRGRRRRRRRGRRREELLVQDLQALAEPRRELLDQVVLPDIRRGEQA